MKVYFEDGTLNNPKLDGMRVVYINASYGPTYCNDLLNKCRFDETVDAIYTNYVEALSATYCWNSETNHADIFLRHPKTQEWTSIDKFYSGLRPSKHIPRMYLNNVFKTIEEN